MNWKKRISILLTILLVLGTAIYPLDTNRAFAEMVDSQEQSSEPATTSDDSGQGSSEKETSSSESGDNGSSSADSSADSGSSETSEISEPSTDSGESENNSTSDKTDPADKTTENSEDNTSQAGKTSDKTITDNDSDSENEKEEITKAVSKKKVVKDDSKGRDYSDLEIVSSGNTTFTIVSVSRDDETISKKLKILKKKKKVLIDKKKKVCARLAADMKEAKDIQSVYDLILGTKKDTKNPEYYLTGCIRVGTYTPKLDRIEGLDDKLNYLARNYYNEHLSEWVEKYTTEYMPQAVWIDEIEYNIDSEHQIENESYSNADKILRDMAKYCQVAIASDHEMIGNIKLQIKDVKEHIKTLKKIKAANTIQLDSRLVEYKEAIPDQAVEFLNAVVAKEGTPYVWGASGPNAFDCSGLVSYGLRECKVVNPGFRWTSYDFAGHLKSIPFEKAVPGDLVWKHGHIAIYIDENTVFEAPYTGARIRFTSCNVASRFSRVLRWWGEEE
ncbi:MAG: C40 family peptidase [Eubacterium sp.]|nr:C40 family peptidase [Eubacterium sp.]